MRVLHLPVNIASIPSHTVRGLRQIGIDAYGLMHGSAIVQSFDGLKLIDIGSRHKPRVFGTLSWSYNFFKWVAWADVIHWYFGTPSLPFGLDLAYVRILGKPGVVEWLGSDIRIPEIEFEDNPYYKTVFQNGYEYQSESYERSRRVQEKFTKAGFATIVPICMLDYVQTDICSKVYVVPQRIMLSDFRVAYPDPKIKKPLIVHAPTAPIAKGTSAVLKAIEQLKRTHNFEFRLIQGMPRKEALELIQKADIFLDQFVLGSYGMASLEAMAFGKPVVCYIKPSMVNKYPPDLPIVNANQDNLAEVLKPLIEDGKLRYEFGRQSRAYVEKYHDAAKLAHQLVGIYEELIKNR